MMVFGKIMVFDKIMAFYETVNAENVMQKKKWKKSFVTMIIFVLILTVFFYSQPLATLYNYKFFFESLYEKYHR